jgi:signal transduction histidine kinase
VLFGDRSRLIEIWQNLIDNAIKYMGDNQSAPCVEIGIDNAGGEPVFYVRDNGIGIEPCYQEKVFSLFEKLDSKSEGTGLGLALVKRIVELYKGRVWFESSGQNCGTCFRFTLPAALAPSKEQP